MLLIHHLYINFTQNTTLNSQKLPALKQKNFENESLTRMFLRNRNTTRNDLVNEVNLYIAPTINNCHPFSLKSSIKFPHHWPS